MAHAISLLLVLLLCARASDAAAVAVTLDPGFGDGGAVTIPGLPGGHTDELFAVTVDPVGRIVAAGYSSGGNQQPTVVRLLADGSLDPTFGDGGVVRIPVGVRARAQALALQPNGRIVVAGFGVLFPGGMEQFVALRLLENGTLDPSFGAGGLAATAFGTRDARALAVSLDDQGRVVLAGWARNSANRDVALVRYDASGAPDPTFGEGGQLRFGVGSGNDEATAVAHDDDGRIVFAGYAADGSTYDFLVGRRLASGAPDESFAGSGVVRISTTDGVEQANALVLQPDGKILLAGESRVDGRYRLAAARVDADGALDTSFSGGFVTTSFGELAEGKAVAAASHGRFVIAGRARLPGGVLRWVVARYLANGALDPTFGDGGVALIEVGNRSDEGYAVALDDDGRIVLAGATRNGNDTDLGLVRLVVETCGDGVLDAGETCDTGGIDAGCCTSACTVAPAGTVCRPAADACDFAEVCDGVSPECGPDDGLPDADDDGVCDDEDICPLDHDPEQEDLDDDTIGDACDPCVGGVPLERTTIRFRGLQTPPGDDHVRITGMITLPEDVALAPHVHGVRLLLHAADGSVLFDVRVPPGEFDRKTGVGWKVLSRGRTHRFRSKAPLEGVVRHVRLVRTAKHGRYQFTVVGGGLDLSSLPLFGNLQLTVVLDPSATGRCGELLFAGPEHACETSEDQGSVLCR